MSQRPIILHCAVNKAGKVWLHTCAPSADAARRLAHDRDPGYSLVQKLPRSVRKWTEDERWACLEKYYGLRLVTLSEPPFVIGVDFASNAFDQPPLPIPPTEDMRVAGIECDAWDRLSSAAVAAKGWPYTCRESADCVDQIFMAMMAARPRAPLMATGPDDTATSEQSEVAS